MQIPEHLRNKETLEWSDVAELIVAQSNDFAVYNKQRDEEHIKLVKDMLGRSDTKDKIIQRIMLCVIRGFVVLFALYILLYFTTPCLPWYNTK